MHKIIHSSFEFDLTNYKISTVEDNHWFSDQFFTKYSFPFDVYLNDDLIKVFGEFLDDNSVFLTTYFEVQYVLHNAIEKATLEITSQVGKKLTFEVRYGFDELPNWNKKLAELPLEVTAITDIYAHAKTIIPQTWPAVNYNYPQIHTNKYDETDIVWSTFQKIINNYKEGEFLVNTFAVENFANRNIIQPLPYILHILTAGFIDAGYTLKGDVTTDINFLRMCLFADIEHYDILNNGKILVYIMFKEYISKNDFRSYYEKTVDLKHSSKYRISGTFNFKSNGSSVIVSEFISIKYNNSLLYIVSNLTHAGVIGNIGGFPFEFIFDTSTDEMILHSLLFESASMLINNIDISEAVVFDVSIEKINADNTTATDEIHVKNEVNLKEAVPDITFGTFVSVLKNWFNIDLTISGKDIYINFIENKINYNNAVILKDFEVLKPNKDFNNHVSFLLKFEDVDSEEFKYDVIFQNKNIIETTDKNVDKDTNTINVDALPLPQKSINLVETAFSFDNGGNNKIYAVLYDGLNTVGLNLTKDSTPICIPSVHQKHYKEWFTFRINAITYQWKFKMFAENLSSIKKKIFAYGRYHIIKTINKSQIAEDLFEVDIESDTLK